MEVLHIHCGKLREVDYANECWLLTARTLAQRYLKRHGVSRRFLSLVLFDAFVVINNTSLLFFTPSIFDLLLVAMATTKTSKEKTGVYIVYTPARRVINLPGALGSYFQPIHFMSKVYFILKLLFTFHIFCIEQLLSALHASLSRSMCMCLLHMCVMPIWFT